MNQPRVLSLHLERILRRLIDFADHTDLAQHPDVKGLAREGFVKIFLKENLPSLVKYKTGEILDQNMKRKIVPYTICEILQQNKESTMMSDTQ
jgi:hypothetical protein